MRNSSSNNNSTSEEVSKDDDDDNVGLSIDHHHNPSSLDPGSSPSRPLQASLALKAAEAELEARIAILSEDLQTAQKALQELRRNVHGSDNPDEKTPYMNLQTITTTTTTTPTGIAHVIENTIPTSKKGYLFKFVDREIGYWYGTTKWALRFVELDGRQGKLSYYGSHLDSRPRYVLSLRGCAVRDDGWKRNPRARNNSPKNQKQGQQEPSLDEPGAYFFVFSIYQQSEDIVEVEHAVPLLKFSTPSKAEQIQWMNAISESCAYCETDQFLLEEAERAAELDKQQLQQRLMDNAMPEAKEGTLPPLYFAPVVVKERTSHKRRPSFSKAPSAVNFRSKTQRNNSEYIDFPPSKPFHRCAAPSYLSVEAPVQNYRGFLNLAILMLIVSNIRLLVTSIDSHGFVIVRLWNHLKDLPHIRRDPWEEFPFVSGFLLQLVFIVSAYCIEWLLSRRKVPSVAGMFLHHCNAHAALIVPTIIVWKYIVSPPVGGILLLHATITWMKLISYMLANEDYRTQMVSLKDKNFQGHSSALALIEHLDEWDADIKYPKNITLRNLLYFWAAPTLTYQIAFPKIARIRWLKVGGIVMRMVLCLTIFGFLLAQIVSPILASLVQDLEANGGVYTVSMMADYGLKLAIANTYIWLLFFYFYFHLCLNLSGELLRFGDRVFYKDWWNSSEISAYWRLWNLPVHYWLIRHVYFPCIRMNLNRTASTFTVFLMSAIMHEVLVSVPFHMIRPWSFIGMMMQIPLVAITKFLYRKYPGTSIGNMIFWLSFCVVGQPMAVLLYTVDYQYNKQHVMAGQRLSSLAPQSSSFNSLNEL